MIPLLLRVMAYAFTAADPPKEIPLWQPGANPTDFGVHLWTERSEREVMARYAARGNPLQIDVEHNNAEAPGTDDPPVQGGYARLEIRDGAPWLVFDWSAYAIEQIATRQRLFLSPEYDVDKQTNEIVRLLRVSLVADPATHNARMLASARRRVRAGGNTMNLALIIAALKAALSAEDPEVAKQSIANLIAEVENMAGGAAGAADPAQAAATPPVADPPKTAAAPDGGMPGAGAGDDDDEEKKAAAAANDPTKCRTPVKAGASAETIAMATRLAELEARDAVRSAREQELEAEARVAAAGNRIPDSLRAFALKLPKADFEVFVAGLPEGKGGPGTGGIRAAARPAVGDRVSGRPDGDLDKETERHLARVFNVDERPTESVSFLPSGRLRLTHLSRPKPAVSPPVNPITKVS